MLERKVSDYVFSLLFEMDTLSAGVRVERGESRGSEREEGKERKEGR